ncbi:hypothetical protein [Aggregatilinea lenta]|uniref:hypothetical protein n=1 Tax=Aggregatilinea lenta TaxID=913108 RepID=UPI000E5A130A|nr:hypothetical protein [Aggregatilinea lenta]
MTFDDVETLWLALLSREPDQIQAAWKALNSEERLAIYIHLKRMASEEGWTDPQRISAQSALDVLGDLADEAAEED